MNVKSEKDARVRIMTGVLIGTVVITWLIAAILLWVVDPAMAPSPELPASALAVGSAVAGLVLLFGVILNQVAPRRAAGRAALLIGGLILAMSGGMLLNDALESGWSGAAAVFGITCGIIQLFAGLLAWIASLSDWLAGQSLVKHLWATEPMHPHDRRAMLLVTAAVALGWLFCALAVVTRFDMGTTGVVAWFVAVWGMPILAGMVVAGWREADPNRLTSLGLAAVAGAALDLLYLLVLGLWYYQFNPVGFAPWWAIMGAIFGATGFGLWELVARRGPKAHPQSR